MEQQTTFSIRSREKKIYLTIISRAQKEYGNSNTKVVAYVELPYSPDTVCVKICLILCQGGNKITKNKRLVKLAK